MLSVVKFFSLLLGEMVVFNLTLRNSGTSGEKYAKKCMSACCAESLQSCPTLRDTMDHSPPGSSVRAILQPRTLEGWPCPAVGVVPTQEWSPLPFHFLPWQAGRFFTSSTTYWRKICQKVQFSRSALSHSLWPHRSTPGFSVHHQLPELVQAHGHRVGDARKYVESNRTKVALPVLTHHTHSFAL